MVWETNCWHTRRLMQPTALCPFSLLGFVLPIFICFGSVWLVYQLMYMVAAFSIIVCKRSQSHFFNIRTVKSILRSHC